MKNVKSRWPKSAEQNQGPSSIKSGAKQVASKGLDAAGPGLATYTTATGGGAIALATGAAAASATGIGLVVVGALATVGASAKSIVAATSSKQHRDTLKKMYERKNAYACVLPEGVDGDRDVMAHERIGANVLPYAIEQKDKKYVRRGISAVPVLGSLPMKIHQAYRYATKENRGVLRDQMAYELAVHLVTHNCGLAQGIVAELFSSYEKMRWMLEQDTDTVTPLLKEKLKSQ
jgi:hypothetical protein